jgi:hypothetical protein
VAKAGKWLTIMSPLGPISEAPPTPLNSMNNLAAVRRELGELQP